LSMPHGSRPAGRSPKWWIRDLLTSSCVVGVLRHHGTRGPGELVAMAAAQGASAAALTDRDGLYGAVRHIRQCIQSAQQIRIETPIEHTRRGSSCAHYSRLVLFTWGRNKRETIAPLLARLDAMAQELESSREEEHRRRKGQLLIAVVIFAITLLASFAFFYHSGTAPTLADPGVIAIARIGSGDNPIDVTTRFDGQTPEETKAVLAITSGGRSDSLTEVVVIVCGNLASGLSITDLNGGPIPLQPLPGSSGDLDSRLGDHSHCSFASIAPFAFQVVLALESPQAQASIADARIIYALPGITTILPRTPLGQLDARPWSGGTTLNVRLSNAPRDFSLDASSPSIQEGGLFSWDYVAGVEVAPLEYRISGVLLDEEDNAQNRSFVAGVLAGVAGAALIWAVELCAGLFLGRRKFGSSSRADKNFVAGAR
jgi:hypothetical protein